jgi:quercetin 2,3-dioxygenase
LDVHASESTPEGYPLSGRMALRKLDFSCFEAPPARSRHSQMPRRGYIRSMTSSSPREPTLSSPRVSSTESAILEQTALGAPPWVTVDPFLFCVHHLDGYPRGNAELGPAASLAGRRIGMDFEGKDGWRMYHGDRVPGFPQHPHRGFETITIVRRGYIDHSDSLGATARFGAGDVQWMTAGRGIVHSEMFPLLSESEQNPLELFQIWMNLPKSRKFVDPYFSMFWSESIPRVRFGAGSVSNADGPQAIVTLIAGELAGQRAPSPPPDSWAAAAEADVAIWTLRLEPGAALILPPARDPLSVRTLYFFVGQKLLVDGEPVNVGRALVLRSDRPVRLEALGEVDALLLQGRPISEPVAHHGPFVMNTQAEIREAIQDYQRTQFGGWPWSSDGPVHARSDGRFARHASGRVERA